MNTWITCDINPLTIGAYLVTTANGAVRIDRWDGESWGLCRPRVEIKARNKGRYKPHRAWMPLPTPAERRSDL